MRLTYDGLLAYPGKRGVDGLCHVRVYEEPEWMPVIVVGQLKDNPGTSITNAIETIAHTIEQQITNGREFELIEHHPAGFLQATSFSTVRFTRRDPDEDPEDPSNIESATLLIDPEAGAQIHTTRLPGGYRKPRWEPMEDIVRHLDCQITIWPESEYTARNVAGDHGQHLQEQVQARAKAAANHFCGPIEGRS